MAATLPAIGAHARVARALPRTDTIDDMESLYQAIDALRFERALPATVLEVEQTFDAVEVADIDGATRQALADAGILARIQPGDTVAVGVGSRGITNIAQIARSAVACLREHGAQPFVVAAMGSHGGGTPDGQREMLHSLGVTEDSLGCEFRITMDVKQIGQLPNGGPALFQDLHSAAADHAIVLSRIKPHTDFRGPVESGPSKMTVIGFGKQKGAALMHSYGGRGFRDYLCDAARIYESNTNYRGAVCILENAYDQTGLIIGLSAAQTGTQIEIDLQARSKDMIARIPFTDIDILVVQRIGKNISGAGMDPNVLQRSLVPREDEPVGGPAIIVTLDLTDETHGNACGLGLANVIPKRLVDKIDFYKFYLNGVTSGTFGAYRNAMPLVMRDDLRTLESASQMCGIPGPLDVRYCFIRDTLKLDTLFVSPAMRREVEAHPRLSIVGERPLAFNAAGAMTSPWDLSGR
jgi:hypothetical protein